MPKTQTCWAVIVLLGGQILLGGLSLAGVNEVQQLLTNAPLQTAGLLSARPGLPARLEPWRLVTAPFVPAPFVPASRRSPTPMRPGRPS